MEDGRKPLLEKQNVITSSVHPCRIHPVEKAPIWTMLVTEIQAKISHIGIKSMLCIFCCTFWTKELLF